MVRQAKTAQMTKKNLRETNEIRRAGHHIIGHAKYSNLYRHLLNLVLQPLK